MLLFSFGLWNLLWFLGFSARKWIQILF
jgi:hypothetical protein